MTSTRSRGKAQYLMAACIPACIALFPSYALAQSIRMSCIDTHSLYVQNGLKEIRAADAKYFLQIDGSLITAKYEGFPNIYTDNVIWRDDNYAVSMQYDKIGGSGITVKAIAFNDTNSILVTRMHVDTVSGVQSSFFSECKRLTEY